MRWATRRPTVRRFIACNYDVVWSRDLLQATIGRKIGTLKQLQSSATIGLDRTDMTYTVVSELCTVTRRAPPPSSDIN